MTIETFIEKAIEGGWNEPKQDCSFCEYPTSSVLLDPLAWQAVGKVENWHDSVRAMEVTGDRILPWWQIEMHNMVDALASGSAIEHYLETL